MNILLNIFSLIVKNNYINLSKYFIFHSPKEDIIIIVYFRTYYI
jgi:hypothetical protein